MRHHTRRSICAAPMALLIALLLALATSGPAQASWLRPLESGGNFLGTVDLAELYDADGQLDVVVMIAVANRELTLPKVGGRWRGELSATASLVSPTGERVEAARKWQVVAENEDDAQSAVLHQIFTLVLEDVPFRSGTFGLDLRDEKRKRPVVFALFSKEKARSELVADWTAPEAAAEPGGLTVGDIVYLAHAPVKEWAARGGRTPAGGNDGPWGYAHPLRRYGVEQTRVQVYFNLLPPTDEASRSTAARDDLRIEVLSKDLDFALRDTLVLTPDVRAVLAAGRPAAVYYELDGSLLPPGTLRLGIAPLGAEGRGMLSEFDVSWRLDNLARGSQTIEGEGRLLFSGDQLNRFRASTRAEQEVMIEEFWRDLDPDPADPYNELYAEFRRRVAYVQASLGGFKSSGPVDDRGLIYVLLGPPDQRNAESMPMNERDQNDARVKVFVPEAPDREGTWAKGANPEGTADQTPYGNVEGIPMPYSRGAARDIAQNLASATANHGFERWSYTKGGDALYPNQYSAWVPLNGLQFLFVDIDGTGHYRLESSNATQVDN